MITKENFAEVLECLGFTKNGDLYSKTFPKIGACTLSVDFKKKQLNYPEKLGFKVNDRTTCNFEHPENFVVFECVHRLLEKEYRPEHIELEKRWNLGHDAKGGKADICVYDKNGDNMLLIIECKTAGTEHKKALKLLNEDGGQLFSYWQQERSTKWLSLYASDYSNGEIIYDNYIVDCTDDENVKKLAAKDKLIRLYEKAQTVKELFDVWDETYDKIIFDKGVIFGDDSQAYQIGVPPLRKKRLEDFKPEDKIVARFEEILRHNNVSDKENAFNRLVALFICKLVDEIQKSDNDVVEFQYKVGTDTYESLQDRLQRLHKEGMEKFMGEEIFYVSDDYAENLFATKLNDKKRQAAINDLKNTIRILKFYSNNDFAFKDVHNEELFFQNGKILVEVVQLFQKYRIVYPSKHQFLGDLFENLLNNGFKQNQGQYFTPMPITRFIWDCLPMDKIIKNGDNFVFPKVIDYACGAGHFLTEAVEAINEYFKRNGNEEAIKENAWCEHHIFGIEKDYRLARVSKVSLYMNGAGQGKIIFGDGLEQYEEKEVTNTSFNVLVANPPYSVDGFKAHLRLKNNRFELLEKNMISNDSKEIESLFVERIAQLLKPKGIAAVVLPSTILSNNLNCYMAAREMLLKNFYLRAVVQFGDKTFGATPETTVVLFLEKYNEPPKKHEIVRDSVNAILSGTFSDDWEDTSIFHSYIQKIGVEEDLYKSFAKEMATKDDLKQCDYFAQYITWFDKLSDIIKKRENGKFCKLSEAEQQEEMRELFYKKVKDVEREKLTYFALIYNQTTLIVTAPPTTTEQKKYLGYEWNNGNIQVNVPGGMLYNNSNRYANDTLAAAVRNSFVDEIIALPENVAEYYSYMRTQDMIDFGSPTFNKTIKTKKNTEIHSKYELVRLSEYVDKFGGLWTGKKPPFKNISVIRNTNFTMQGKLDLSDVAKIDVEVNQLKKRQLKEGDIIIEKSGGSSTQAVGRVVLYSNIKGEYSYSNFTERLRIKNEKKDKLSYEYLHAYLNLFYQNGNTFFYQTGSSGLKNLKMPEYMSQKIPLPPIPIQNQIVSEYKKIDEEYSASRMSLEDYRIRIQKLFESLGVISE